MATKDRTATFLRFKDEYKNSRPYTSHRPSSNVPLMHGENGIPLQTLGVAPQWIKVHDIEANLSRIQVKIDELSKYHSQNILNFDGESEDEKIDILTDEISKIFKKTHNLIKQLGEDKQLKPEEIKIKKNIQSAMSAKLQTLSQLFRKKQKLYLNSLQKNATSFNWGTNNNNEDTYDDDEEDFKMGFTKEQLEVVEAIEDSIMERDRDIRKIVASVNELSTLLNDISLLVIQQGTIFDQIEYNLEQTESNLVVAADVLVETDKQHKAYRTRLCILLVLVILVVSMVFVTIIKALI